MNIVCKAHRFYFELDGGMERLLFNAVDCVSNCSRIPFFQVLEDDMPSYPVEEFLKQAVDVLSAENEHSRRCVLRAAALLLIFPELVKKYRPYRILQLGSPSLLTAYLARLLPQLHPRASLCCISEDISSCDEPYIIQIRAAYRTFPFPRNHFDVVLVDSISSDVLQDIFPSLVSSVVPNGFFVCLPPMGERPSCLEGFADSMGDETDRIMFATVSGSQRAAVLHGTVFGLLQEKKYAVSRLLSEMESSLPRLLCPESMAANDTLLLDRLISETARAEEIICEIYEDLASLDIKYSINLFKEALIKMRLEENAQNLPEKIKAVRSAHHQLQTELELDFPSYVCRQSFRGTR